MDLSTVLVSAAVGGVTSAITAYFTSKLKISEEREKWFRDFASKYAESLATNPAVAANMSKQFAVAMLLVTDLKSTDGDRRKFFIPPNSRLIAGRDEQCDIPVTDPVFSRHSVAFSAGLTDVFVETLATKNSVLLNGEQIEGRTKLKDGDRVEIGSTQFSLMKLS